MTGSEASRELIPAAGREATERFRDVNAAIAAG